MQLLSLLLSFILAIMPGMPILAPVKDAVHEYNVSQQAREMITEEQLAQVALAMEGLAENGFLNFSPLTLLEENEQALMVAYSYACLYSVNDGLSVGEVVRIQFPIAAGVQVVGRGIYTVLLDEYWKHDANVHYLWAFKTARRIGAEASRIHLINYEIAVFFVRPVIRFADERYKEFLQQGQGEWEARWNAWVEGGAYGLNRREIMLEEAGDFDVWNQYFSNSEVMDLWNDRMGQLAAANAGLLENGFMLFLDDWDSGRLVMNETDEEASMERRRIIFEDKSMWDPTVKP